MMKKVCMLLIFVSVFIFGCSNETKDLKEDPGLDKSQKIEVSSEENPELVLSVIDNQDEVNEFVNTLEINKWRIVDTPSTSTKEYIYKMYQEDTVKLGEPNTDEKGLKQFAAIITYKDSPYIELRTKILDLYFKVPKDVAEYLSNKENQKH
ncbi:MULTISPECIES: hypothetical protein [unclassified Bacillus (in: firmicutes)]|uniref:hypothetical protein n=1 Tax=unclassified Bacillus (in: firmicutes) TaxID=185979 RepID=UPI001BE5329E|nr:MULTISPECIES: hypothetical protein [unclassified Bacillus (in: firmicutes)]MBT2616305.1 hypothetical protein [Bacillus sp. ISL-78]MBT2632307.1 hypothetical protein [Bacillus sp. ISL-101]